ncbi:unnamed protein product [Peronospora belbahrii]|uniref:Cellulose synthase 3 n=1 Tax=Peronospora belbahrii TaxID=622444 RepID=A0ABN8CWK0_9STRA|nr:unnamed protein product [Peronospora belbahrii]
MTVSSAACRYLVAVGLLSLGARSLFVTTQFLSAFAMGFVIAFTAIVSLSDTNEWVAIAAGSGAGFLVALIVGFVTFCGPYILILVTSGLIGAYLLLFDAFNGINVFPADNQLARQEFIVAFMIIFELICCSTSKTTELENHRFKYVIFSSITGGWLAADGISRLIDSAAVLSDVAFQSIQQGGKAAVTGMDGASQTLMFVIWGAVVLIGGLNQLSMRWGLMCYNRVGAHAQLGPVEEQLPELPTVALLFCTECGEAMPSDDANPDVSISQAQMPSVAMNSKTQAPDRWQQVPHRTYLSTTSFVDPKHAKEGGVSMKDNGRSIRFMDSGVQGPDGKMSQYNDSIAGVRNYYEPSFRSFAMSTYSIANRAAEPVETPNIRKYKMSGSGMFHVFYFGTAATGIVWLYYLTTMYPQQYFCDHARPTLPCNALPTSEVAGCFTAFAGTNAVFRRQAFDSIGGIQYGTQTEDAYTGNVLHTSGWDSVYFRKDFEGDAKDRIRLCEGAVPETVAAAMGQKKRWAKGAVQILLMKNESEVDPDWRPPRVPAPDPKPSLTFPRKMFFYDSVLYPFGSIPALCYVSIAVYYLCTGDAPIYARGTKFLYSFLPVTFCRWVLNLLANRAVDNNDVWRAQQTWFSFSFITMMAIIEAIQARMTGKDKSWANTGAGQKTSWTEIPNVLFFFTLLFSQLVALIRFFEYENATNPWNYVSSMFFGFFVMSQFYPMVKMSITEYCGWDHTAATFTANVFGSLLVVYIVVFVQLWQVYYAGNLQVAQGTDGGGSTAT